MILTDNLIYEIENLELTNELTNNNDDQIPGHDDFVNIFDFQIYTQNISNIANKNKLK